MKSFVSIFCGWLLIAGAERPWTMHTIDGTLFGADGTKLAYANPDRHPDIVTGWEQSNVARLYLHPGKPTAQWPYVEVPAPAVEDAFVADLDGDGFGDIITLSEGNEQRVTIHWAPGHETRYGQSQFWQSSDLPCAYRRSRWMFGIPMQVDGKHGLDLVVGSKDPAGTLGWLEAPASPRDPLAWRFHPIGPAGWVMSIVEMDVDRDGLNDLLVSDRYGSNRGIRWLKNPGPGKAQMAPWPNQVIGLTQGQPMFMHATTDTILAMDLNAGLVRFTRSENHPWQADTIAYPTFAGTRGKAVTQGDLNADGRADLVMSFEGARDRHGVVWRDAATNAFKSISGKRGVKYDLVLLLDMDDDGDLDVVTSEENNNSTTDKGLGVVWFENPDRD